MPTPHMQISENGLALLRGDEAIGAKPNLTSYQDQRGIWTIGFGHTRNVFPGMTCTVEQANQWLVEDAAEAEAAVNVGVDVPMTQNQFDATVSLAYNIGNMDFKGSTVLRLLNDSNYTGAAQAFLMWNKTHIDGVLTVDDGLTNRRKREMALFLTPEVA